MSPCHMQNNFLDQLHIKYCLCVYFNCFCLYIYIYIYEIACDFVIKILFIIGSIRETFMTYTECTAYKNLMSEDVDNVINMLYIGQ